MTIKRLTVVGATHVAQGVVTAVVFEDELTALESRLAAAETERDNCKENYVLLMMAAKAAEAALRTIATPALRRTDENSTVCLRCGMETFHQKDGEVRHEKDCVQVYAASLIDAEEVNDD